MLDREWKKGDTIDVPVEIQEKIKKRYDRIQEVHIYKENETKKEMQEIYNLLAIHLPEINKDYKVRVDIERMKINVEGYEHEEEKNYTDLSQVSSDIEKLKSSLKNLC